jgi:hypothetical protein
MEPVYWNGDLIEYKMAPERVYCKGKDHKGKSCSFRATHKDTQLCGLHHGNYTEGLLTPIKPLKLNGEVLKCFPMKENEYILRPRWMMPFKRDEIKCMQKD